MTLKEILDSRGFAVTGERTPKKSVSRESILEPLSHLADSCDAVNITDNQRACVRSSSLAVAALLLGEEVEPVYQLTCRDRNRIGLQSDLLGAHMLGVRNVLALTGDHPSVGDHPSATPVYDLDSTQLIQAIHGFNLGVDLEGNPIEGETSFFIGAACNPGAQDRELEVERVKRKINAGAQFFQTQVVYDIDEFKDFKSHLPGNTKILAGVVPLKSRRMAEFMNNKVPGVNVPEDLIKELDSSKNPLQTGLEQAVELVRGFRESADGVHVMALGLEHKVPEILEKAGVR